MTDIVAFDRPQPPRTVTADLWLVTSDGERKLSQEVPVGIEHRWVGFTSEYIFHLLRVTEFTIHEEGLYMAMIFITDDKLGEFWVDLHGGVHPMNVGDTMTISASTSRMFGEAA